LKIFAVVINLVLLVTLFACHKNELSVEQTQIVKPVYTYEVVAAKNASLTFSGVVDAYKKADLKFRTPGELQSVLVKEGQFVQQGQLLASLDKTDFYINYSSVKAQYEKQLAEFNRYTELNKKGVISQAQLDATKSTLASSKSSYDSAAQTLEYADLKAPFDGVVAQRYFDDYENISTNTTFAILHDLTKLKVLFKVPQNLMQKMKSTQQYQAYATLGENSEQRYPLSKEEFTTTTKSTEQSYLVTLSMPSPKDITVLPGMSVQVTVILLNTDLEKNQLSVPAHSVVHVQGENFVYVAVPNKEHNDLATIEKRRVIIGNVSEQELRVLSGLQLGEKVVSSGMSKMHSGLTVKLMVESKL